jgi:5'-3' exoribonuclease 1
MNGIVHACTHGGGVDGSTAHPTEEQMMVAIFKYIDKLFQLCKPRNLLFMAIDGVAPRAKMNQQRQRRFRSALDAEMLANEQKRAGTYDDTREHFDSNWYALVLLSFLLTHFSQ